MFLHDILPGGAQRKVDGVKAVVTLSSSVAQMGRVSAAARALDTPLGAFDRFQFAYKVSKTGLNQGALWSWQASDLRYAILRMRREGSSFCMHLRISGAVTRAVTPQPWRTLAVGSFADRRLPHPALDDAATVSRSSKASYADNVRVRAQ